MTFCNPYKGGFSIYKITNPIGQIYIGVTSSLYKRLFSHSHSDKYSIKHHSGLMRESVGKFGWDSHSVEIVWFSRESNEKEAYNMEMQMIIKYNSHYLDNKGIGLNKRRGHHDNSYLKMSKHCVPVYQYNMETGDFIAEFGSSNEAARSLDKNKYAVSCISNARMGRSEYAFGYYWSAVKYDNYKPIKIGKITNNIRVVKMDRFATTIHDVYTTVKDAAKKNSMSVADMVNSINSFDVFNNHVYISDYNKSS
jgi:predicted GIY-YIG superfamily endonuclease